MGDIAGVRPPVDPTPHIDPLHLLRQTLQTHYRNKRRKYLPDDRHYYDRPLKRLFSGDARGSTSSAAAFLAREAAGTRRRLAGDDFESAYFVSLVLNVLSKRSRELGLRTFRPADEVQPELLDIVSRMTADFRRVEHVVPV